MAHHLIFEGAELVGKSWLMSQIYNYLEGKYNQSGHILDGCHWFNADVGIFGLPEGKAVIEGYLRIFEVLKDRNILAEKLHISDMIYNSMYRQVELDYRQVEESLVALDFKIVLITFPEEKALIAGRIKDRLRLYPHYARIAHEPEWYIEQQRLYRQKCADSALPVLEVPTNTLPDDKLVEDILGWIGEN